MRGASTAIHATPDVPGSDTHGSFSWAIYYCCGQKLKHVLAASPSMPPALGYEVSGAGYTQANGLYVAAGPFRAPGRTFFQRPSRTTLRTRTPSGEGPALVVRLRLAALCIYPLYICDMAESETS